MLVHKATYYELLRLTRGGKKQTKPYRLVVTPHARYLLRVAAADPWGLYGVLRHRRVSDQKLKKKKLSKHNLLGHFIKL